MKKGIKVVLVIAIVSILMVVSIGAITLTVIKQRHKPIPYSMENAPKEILEIREELSGKLENETFIWSDMNDFLIFAQYVADNSPDVLEIISDWEETVLFDVTDEDEGMWFFIDNNSAIVEIGTNPPTNFGILITLDFATMVHILKRDITPQQAFQKGDLKFEGDFSDVLKINQVVEIAALTLMGTYVSPPEISDNFTITVDERKSYLENGLTLLPNIKVNIDPLHEGEFHAGTPAGGKAIIVDNTGQIIHELDDSAHTVHQFINSTTIAMGGQEGMLELWNFKENIVETLDVPGGHHAFDYNPETKTFMLLEYVYSSEIWDGLNVLYDRLAEYTVEGELIWEWDARIHFPFNATRHTSLGLNQTFRGGADWMHSNSFAWDKDEDAIYLCARNLDTILKINYTTKEIVWQAGRLCNFTLYNKFGYEEDSLFHQPHGLEKIGANRFIIFDNDLYNESNPSTMNITTAQGNSRFLEFEINEIEETMTELWSWTARNNSYYFPESGGDADRLPDGNTIGMFGNKAVVLNLRDLVYIVEVTEAGEVAWELTIDGVNDTYFWIQTLERFYEKPLIDIHTKNINLTTGEIELSFKTWNGYKIPAKIPGMVKIMVDGETFYEEAFEFLPNWQFVEFNIFLQNIPNDVKVVQLIVENQDGIQHIEELYNSNKGAGRMFLIIGLPIIGTIAISTTTVVLVRIRIKKNKIIKEVLN